VFRSCLRNLILYRLVLYQFIKLQLTVRYRRTILGYFWTLINPLLMMTVTTVVFSMLLKMEIKTYAVFLFAALVPWNCFSSIITQSASSLVANESLIKKIYLPRMIFPLSISLGLLVDNLLSFMLLLLLMCIVGANISLALLFLPVSFLLLFCLVLGIGLVLSVITVYFRDLQHIIGVILQALFFLTPVVYRPQDITGKLSWIIDINPLSPFILLFRGPIVDGVLPSAMPLLHTFILSTISLSFGYWFFRKYENKIVYRL